MQLTDKGSLITANCPITTLQLNQSKIQQFMQQSHLRKL